MKILHLSDGTLPDIRIERAAINAIEKKHEVIFAGGAPVTGQIFNAFTKTYSQPWTRYQRLGIPFTARTHQKWLWQILQHEEPDLIHAHDLFAGKLALDLGYPFVYDDHEYWGVQIKDAGTQLWQPRREPHRRLALSFATRNWRRWEALILHQTPCITVSEEIARIYRKIQPNTYVIPNVPTRKETKIIPPNTPIDSEFRVAYISARGDLAFDARGDAAALGLWRENQMEAKLVFVGPQILKSSNVENHGFVPHNDMFQIIANCDVALMGWETSFPHLSIQNKFALFLHTGLRTMLPKSLVVMGRFATHHNVGWIWHSPDELKTLIQELSNSYFADPDAVNQEKKRTRAVAQKYLLWEQYEARLYEAYEAVLSNS
ncbi:MAG: glycosyltransferase [Candidatus Hodarchaeota archaeon]